MSQARGRVDVASPTDLPPPPGSGRLVRTPLVAGVPVLVAAMVAGGPPADAHVVREGDTQASVPRQHGTEGRRGTDGRDGRGGGGGGGYRVRHVTYTVRPGDSLWLVARRTGLAPASLAAANGLDPSAELTAGQRLVLPGLRPAAARRRARPRPLVHVVVPGDTVSAVAARSGLDVDAVLRANGLGPTSLLRPGRKLVLPRTARTAGQGGAGRRKAAVPPTHAHVVRRGETVWGIATAAGVDPAAVLALNALDGGAILLPGRRLLLPGPGPRSRHASATEAAPQDAVTVAAAANRIALARRPAPSRARTRALVAATARRLGVDPALAQAVAYQESGFRHHVVSSANAVGVMQVVPSSGRWASDLVGRPLDLLDAHDNVVAGVAILAALTAGRSEGTAIAAYYQGLTSVARDGLYPDTRRYVANVRTLAARFRARTPGPDAGRT